MIKTMQEFKKNLENAPDTIKFLTNLLVGDINSIQDFDQNNIYIRDQKVYTYDESTNTHAIYVCVVDVTKKGVFNVMEWMRLKLF